MDNKMNLRSDYTKWRLLLCTLNILIKQNHFPLFGEHSREPPSCCLLRFTDIQKYTSWKKGGWCPRLTTLMFAVVLRASLCHFVFQKSVCHSVTVLFFVFGWWVDSCKDLNWSDFTFFKNFVPLWFLFQKRAFSQICRSIPTVSLVFISVYRVFWFPFLSLFLSCIEQ